MGRRYAEEEKRHLQELVDQGHTDEAISQQIGCSINIIRNIRHRTNIKKKEIQSIQQLHEERYKLTQKT